MANVKAVDLRGINLSPSAFLMFHTIEFKKHKFDLFESVQVETRNGEFHEGAITAITSSKFELDYSTVIKFSEVKDIHY